MKPISFLLRLFDLTPVCLAFSPLKMQLPSLVQQILFPHVQGFNGTNKVRGLGKA
jgi:hypothetical protein